MRYTDDSALRLAREQLLVLHGTAADLDINDIAFETGLSHGAIIEIANAIGITLFPHCQRLKQLAIGTLFSVMTYKPAVPNTAHSMYTYINGDFTQREFVKVPRTRIPSDLRQTPVDSHGVKGIAPTHFNAVELDTGLFEHIDIEQPVHYVHTAESLPDLSTFAIRNRLCARAHLLHLPQSRS